jgi:hypothetical protein
MNIDIQIDKKEFKKKLDIKDGRTPIAGIDYTIPENGTYGKDGKDGKNGKDGKDGKNGKDGSPDTGEQVIVKINKDKSDEKIKKEKVEGLSELEDEIKVVKNTNRLGLRAAGDTVYLADLSTQTNGVLKSFTIPLYRRPIMVIGSDFPTALFLNNGFTIVPGTVTLTTDNAPSSGSQLGFLYIV